MRIAFSPRYLVTTAFLCGCLGLLAWQGFPARADDDDEDEKVHDLMDKTHEGKNSPWKKSQRAAAAEPLDWATLTAALRRFEAMAQALAKSPDNDVRQAADGYVDAVKALLAETKKKNAAGARGAIKALSQSCADCHYKGGPGGKLD